jgi:hypothetical protein
LPLYLPLWFSYYEGSNIWLLYDVLWLPTDTWYGLVVLRYLSQISLAGFFWPICPDRKWEKIARGGAAGAADGLSKHENAYLS